MELPLKLRDSGIAGLPRRRFVLSTGTGDRKQAENRAREFAGVWQAQIDAAMSEGGKRYFLRAVAKSLGLAEPPETFKEALRVLGGADIRTIKSNDLGDGRTVETDQDTGDTRIIPTPPRPKVRDFAKHLDEWPRLAKLQPKQRAMYKSDILEFAGRFPAIQDVNGADVKQWTMELSAGGITSKTIARKLAAVRGYWKHLRAINVAPAGSSPFAELDLPRDSERDDADDTREAFTAADVLKLVKAARWGDEEHKADAELADVIEVARWTGARRQSICALRIEDIKLADKIPHLCILKDKSKAGRRDVPIHSRLAPTLRRLIGKRKNDFLFAGLKEGKYGDRSNGVGNRFGRLKTRLGFGEQFVFHSIRKTVATLLENAGVAENVAADIVGHKKKTMTYGLYSGGTSLALKYEAIKKLSYGKENLR